MVTVNPNRPPVTETSLVYETTHLEGTVWVGYVLRSFSALVFVYLLQCLYSSPVAWHGLLSVERNWSPAKITHTSWLEKYVCRGSDGSRQTQYTTITNEASATACLQAGGWYGR